jgi:hypothetical protein
VNDTPRREYEPPTGDEPLDAIEQAIVRILVPIIAAQIREELAAEQVPAEPISGGRACR